jgi:signal transduction histidine kinase
MDATQNGEILLEASFKNNYITVHVSDTGEGVPPEFLSRVFERGVSGKGGKGYGLAICKTIVEAHGGEIKIKSEQGKGTAVTFTIPVYGGQSEGRA